MGMMGFVMCFCVYVVVGDTGGVSVPVSSILHYDDPVGESYNRSEDPYTIGGPETRVF